MKLLNYLAFLFAIILTSCSERNDTIDTNKEFYISAYRINYMEYPFNTLDLVDLKYENGKVIRRTSNFSIVSPISPTIFYHKYEKIEYNGNIIQIVSKSLTDDSEILGSKIQVEMEGDKIIKKTYYIPDYPRTSNYFYINNKISKIYSSQEGLFTNYSTYQKDFFYNSDSNLDSIVTRYAQYNYINNSYELNANSKKREVDFFSNYDNSNNTTKKLAIFDEVFIRTLSKNNFRDYKKIGYDENGNQTSYATKSWNYVYTNGEIDFAK